MSSIVIGGSRNNLTLVSRIASALNTSFLVYDFFLDNSRHYFLNFSEKLKLNNLIIVLNNINTNSQILELMFLSQFNKKTNVFALLCPEYSLTYPLSNKLIILNPYQKISYQDKCLTFDTYHGFVYSINLLKKKLNKVSFLFIDNSDFSHFISNKYCYEQLFYIDNCIYSELSKNIIIIGSCCNNKLKNIISKFSDYNLYIFFANIFNSFELLKYNCVKDLYISNYIDYVCTNDIYAMNKCHKIDITQYIVNFLKTL